MSINYPEIKSKFDDMLLNKKIVNSIGYVESKTLFEQVIIEMMEINCELTFNELI
jgi:hypothetical protein